MTGRVLALCIVCTLGLGSGTAAATSDHLALKRGERAILDRGERDIHRHGTPWSWLTPSHCTRDAPDAIYCQLDEYNMRDGGFVVGGQALPCDSQAARLGDVCGDHLVFYLEAVRRGSWITVRDVYGGGLKAFAHGYRERVHRAGRPSS